jgi:hypothetical protein
MAQQPVTFSASDIDPEKGQVFNASDVDTGSTKKSGPPSALDMGWEAAKGFAQNLDPRPVLHGLYDSTQSPLGQMLGPTGAELDFGGKLVGAQWDLIKQGYQAYQKGDYKNALQHTVAGLTPLIGPGADDALTDMRSDDPRQQARGFGKAVGLIAPFGAGKVLKVAGMVPEATRLGLADTLDTSATDRFVRAVTPQTGAQKGRFASMAAKAAPDALRDPTLGAFTQQGFWKKVGTGLDEAGSALDEAQNARNPHAPVDTAPIVKALKARRAELVAQPFDADLLKPKESFGPATVTREGPKIVTESPVQKSGQPLGQEVVPDPSTSRVATLDKIISEVESLGPVAPYRSLWKIRDSWDNVAKMRFSPVPADDFAAQAARGRSAAAFEGTSVLRQSLANADPVTAAANGPYSLYAGLNQVGDALEASERVRPNRGAGIVKAGATAIAEGMGGTPAAIKTWLMASAIDAASKSGVTMQIAIARSMTRLADALRRGNAPAARSMAMQIASMTKTTPILQQALSHADAGLPLAAQDQNTTPAGP